jgi:hypothetical protein
MPASCIVCSWFRGRYREYGGERVLVRRLTLRDDNPPSIVPKP